MTAAGVLVSIASLSFSGTISVSSYLDCPRPFKSLYRTSTLIVPSVSAFRVPSPSQNDLVSAKHHPFFHPTSHLVLTYNTRGFIIAR